MHRRNRPAQPAPITLQDAFKLLGELLSNLEQANPNIFRKFPQEQLNHYRQVCRELRQGQQPNRSTFYRAMGYNEDRETEVHRLVDVRVRQLFNPTPQGMVLRRRRITEFFYDNSIAYWYRIFWVLIAVILMPFLAQLYMEPPNLWAWITHASPRDINRSYMFFESLIFLIYLSALLVQSIAELYGIVAIPWHFAENLRAEERATLAGINGIDVVEYSIYAPNSAYQQRQEIFQRPIYNQSHLADLNQECAPLVEELRNENGGSLYELFKNVREVIRPRFSVDRLGENQHPWREMRELLEFYVILGLIVGQNSDRYPQKSARN